MTASNLAGSTPAASALYVTSAPAAFNPARIVSAFGKSAFVFAVPCHVNAQPPVWLAMLSAALPTTRMRLFVASGSAGPSFFSSTSDSRTARRASSRSCSAASLPA